MTRAFNDPRPAAEAPADAIETIRAFVTETSAATVRLTALGLALRSRSLGIALHPAVAAAADAVLRDLGLAGAVGSADPAALRPVLALLRAELLFGGHILLDGTGERGWVDRDADVLQSFGEVSVGFPDMIDRLIAPVLPDLVARLEAPGARFLDIGTGVGWLSIGMLRRWPGLRATGVEPLPGALAIARQNLRATGLAERMELRSGRGEDLSDRGIFDLAFVPSAFIDAGHLPEILARVHAALRPGVWVLLAVIEPDGTDPSAAALARFRASVWGGEALGVAGGTALLAEAGFARVVPVRQPRGMITFVAAEGGE